MAARAAAAIAVPNDEDGFADAEVLVRICYCSKK